MTENNKLQTIEQQLVQEKNVSDNVLNKVRVLESQGNLELPNDYSPSNAMKQAWLQISQDNKLMSCNDTSKANALLDMVTQGLNPAKNQCYFIPYGNKMQLQRSYHGNVMMLKRDAGAQDVVAQVIYKGDTFKQEMGETGRIKAIKHEQDFFNIDKENIIGAYCTIVFNDGRDNYIVTVERGQRLTSILTLSDLFNWSRFKVKTFLDLLESDGMLEVKTTSKYTLITIVNYDFYQSEQGRNQHQNDIKPTSKQHQSNINPTSKQHQTNTNNNDNKDNNEKNVNNEKKKATAFDFFQDNGFGFITPYNLDDLNYYLDSFENDSDEIVTASLKIAKDRNKVTWGYAKSILNTWLNANLKSIEQVRAFEKQQLESKKQNYKPFVKQSKEKTPKWLTDSTRETKTPEVDENLEKDREAFIKRLNSKWE